MTVTFLGCGYLGLTYAAVFAAAGIKTYAVELNPDRLNPLKQGKAFFFEEGLEELISVGLKNGKLIPTDSYKDSIPNSDVVFSSVGTPDNPDGSPNLDYIYAAANEAAKYMSPKTIFVQKSTVPVGTGSKIITLFDDNDSKAIYMSSPEFLAESTSVRDVLYYDRLVIGGTDKKGTDAILKLHETVDNQRDQIAKIAGIKPVKRLDERVFVSIKSAELIKAAANSFLALKISFANSIAKLADASGADIVEVMDGVGIDQRIGRAFLNAGRGYGGGCFPKDVSGLIHSASDYGVDLSIMEAAQELNESMPGYIANRIKQILGGLKGKKIAVLGLSFKAGTSDVRQSPGIKIANLLDIAGSSVSVYDPHANGEAKKDLRSGIKIGQSALEAADDANAVIIATAWPEFRDLDFSQLKQTMLGTLIYDADNALDKDQVKKEGFVFSAPGRSA